MDDLREPARRGDGEEQARRRYDQVLEALDHLESGLALYGPDDRVVFCNRRFREIYAEVSDLLVPGVRYEDIARAYYRRCFRERTPLDEDVYVRSRVEKHGHPDEGDYEFLNGAGQWLLVSDRRTRDGGVVGLRLDITARRHAEQALRESESRYRTLLETTTDAVLMVDEGSVIRYVNPAVETLFGWRPEEITGKPLAVLQPERLRRSHEAGMARFLASNERRVNWRAMESLGLHREGHEFPIELSFSVTRTEGVRYLIGFVRDIALRKRAETELHGINAMLERRVQERTSELSAANRELESFSYTVAHDLRAPLRAIDGFSQVLEENLGGSLDAESEGYLKRIRANTAVMARMIDELLDFSRLGRAELDIRPVDLDAIARQVIDELRAANPAARVEVDGLPRVCADQTLMRIVLANLVGNAFKFSAKVASPCVRVSAQATRDEVVVSVEDNGVGFDPQYASKLFGVFQRLHPRHEFEGTGIGLATVARIVSRHGGRVWAESGTGEGARFHFSIPAVAGERPQGPPP